MNRKHLLGATLALTSLTTAGVLIATNEPPGVASGTGSQSLTSAASGQLLVSRQEQRDYTAQQHRISGAQARAATAAKAAALRPTAAGRASVGRPLPAQASRGTTRAPISSTAPTYSGDARGIARSMLGSFGWSAGEFPCLDSLWMRESGWRVNAANPSGAYGIPQALPGSKMAAYGSDWRTNPRTQITWGLHYIQGRYGSPCGAWSHFQSHGWY